MKNKTLPMSTTHGDCKLSGMKVRVKTIFVKETKVTMYLFRQKELAFI